MKRPTSPGAMVGRKSLAKQAVDVVRVGGCAGIQRDGHEARQHPGDGAEPFQEVARHQPDAGVVFRSARAAHGHGVGRGHPSDQAVDGDHDHVERGDLARGHDGENVRIGDRFPQAGHAAHRTQGKGQDEEGQDHGQYALDQVGDDRRIQPARYTVDDEQHRHCEYGDLGADRSAGDRGDHGARCLEDHADVDRELQHADQGEEHGNALPVAHQQVVCRGHRAHAPEQRRKQPVEGRGEQPQPLVPDAGCAGGVCL